MIESTNAVQKLCLKCGKRTENDAELCSSCGFDSSSSTTINGEAYDAEKTQIETASKAHRRNTVWYVLGGVVVLGALALFFGIFNGYKQNTQAPMPETSVANANAAPSPFTLSIKAQQLEDMILRGETLYASDLEGLPQVDLRLLRNAHFARYGRKYTQPELADYFQSRPWYKPSDSYNDNMLTATDKNNIKLILAVEKPEIVSKVENSNVSPASSNTPATDSSKSGSGNYLSQDEMLSLMKRNGIWSPMDGWHKYQSIEILRVGEFNEEKKFYPVQVRAKQTTMDGKTWVWVWDCRIIKNDYGDWEARKTSF
ncbi:MAG TPA: YARHG domain-containing protein [Pyrinomonadaceae bacterium]|jgi:ribosomal protein L37E